MGAWTQKSNGVSFLGLIQKPLLVHVVPILYSCRQNVYLNW